jgi:hypothetical protein
LLPLPEGNRVADDCQDKWAGKLERIALVACVPVG